jgi:hypothetical protein
MYEYAIGGETVLLATTIGCSFASFLVTAPLPLILLLPYAKVKYIKLWNLYDCTDWAANLFNCPTVAYSGENDRQKQAADVMAAAMKREGMTLLHLIGPGTGHAYHPQTKQEINRRIDRIVQRGREPTPSRVVFTTCTLRYNKAFWLTVDGLNEHW